MGRTMAYHRRKPQRDPIAVRRETALFILGEGQMTVGERIKRARSAAKLSRKDLAERAGIPYPTLAGLENGDQKNSTAIPALAQVLGVTAMWLATGRGGREALPVKAEDHEPPYSAQPLSTASHLGRLTPAILTHAEKWVRFEEGAGDAYSAEIRAERIFSLCRQAIEDGGALSPEHAQELIDAARARQKQRKGNGNGGREEGQRD
jgi:transcriptional regulator with XRE-family HTH domain